ncbi:MAG: hypothetical protein NTX52_14375 [Planctomycetota bacterium]|nr:hypothetical protein [Planctomycetota bacterium]
MAGVLEMSVFHYLELYPDHPPHSPEALWAGALVVFIGYLT